jgi:hypothetical protein
MSTSSVLKTLLMATTGATLIALKLGGVAQAASITTFYGDDDGFGVGQTTGTLTDPDTSHKKQRGEAPLTDQRLVGGSFFFPAFAPTGSFNPFRINPGEIITAASLTLRTGAFDSGPNPVGGLNRILLDGLEVPSSFINGFSTVNGNQIETQTINLASSFFSRLADGLVSLAGTYISDASGSGSFQVDFVRLDITTQAADPEPSPMAAPAPSQSAQDVPEPASVLGLLVVGTLGAGSTLKRKQK